LQTKVLPSYDMQDDEAAVKLYENQGGSLTRESNFGTDLLEGTELQQQRDQVFCETIFPTIGSVASVFALL